MALSYCFLSVAAIESTICHMEEIKGPLKELFNRIPRRHTEENVKELYDLLDAYEDLLKRLEADPQYEKQIVPFFEELDPIRTTIKSSNSNKSNKRGKDVLFDEASTALKDTMEELMRLLG